MEMHAQKKSIRKSATFEKKLVRDLKYLEYKDFELIYEQLASARRLPIAFIKKTDDL